MYAMLHDLRDGTPQARWPAIQAELDSLDRATRREFPDPADRAIATRPDRQGIGSPR
jgi:hypothetical protein